MTQTTTPQTADMTLAELEWRLRVEEVVRAMRPLLADLCDDPGAQYEVLRQLEGWVALWEAGQLPEVQTRN
jgi:hypothetical protein